MNAQNTSIFLVYIRFSYNCIAKFPAQSRKSLILVWTIGPNYLLFVYNKIVQTKPNCTAKFPGLSRKSLILVWPAHHIIVLLAQPLVVPHKPSQQNSPNYLPFTIYLLSTTPARMAYFSCFHVKEHVQRVQSKYGEDG